MSTWSQRNRPTPAHRFAAVYAPRHARGRERCGSRCCSVAGEARCQCRHRETGQERKGAVGGGVHAPGVKSKQTPTKGSSVVNCR